MGELRLGALAFAPHVADPRLSEMRCGWVPYMTSYCGKVGKVIEVNRSAVKLYSCGKELLWDIELFDSCLERYCHKGCSLQQTNHKVVGSPYCFCDVCLAWVPVGVPFMCCAEHDYNICTYCLGKPSLPAVGERVIRGPTWSSNFEDYCEDGIVETALLGGNGLARADDNIEMPQRSYHSYFQASCGSRPQTPGYGCVLLLCMKFLQYPNVLLTVVFFEASLCLRHRDAWASHEVRWLTSGRRSYCRGPPYQDVTLAFDNGLSGLTPATVNALPQGSSDLGRRAIVAESALETLLIDVRGVL